MSVGGVVFTVKMKRCASCGAPPPQFPRRSVESHHEVQCDYCGTVNPTHPALAEYLAGGEIVTGTLRIRYGPGREWEARRVAHELASLGHANVPHGVEVELL